jgi:hypothetical protein
LARQGSKLNISDQQGRNAQHDAQRNSMHLPLPRVDCPHYPRMLRQKSCELCGVTHTSAFLTPPVTFLTPPESPSCSRSGKEKPRLLTGAELGRECLVSLWVARRSAARSDRPPALRPVSRQLAACGLGQVGSAGRRLRYPGCWPPRSPALAFRLLAMPEWGPYSRTDRYRPSRVGRHAKSQSPCSRHRRGTLRAWLGSRVGPAPGCGCSYRACMVRWA